MTLEEFAVWIRDLGDQVVTNANELKKKSARTLVTELARHTPAHVGVAVSNWRTTTGSAATGVIPAYVPGQYGSTKDANAQAAIDAAEHTISGVVSGQEIYTVNNTPYIGILNSGSSSQAPAGFIEAAVEVATAAARDGKIL